MAILLVTAVVGAILQKSTDPVTLVGNFQGHEVGTATFATTVLPDKSWVRSFTSRLNFNGSVLESRVKSQFSSDGRLVQEDDVETLNGEPKHDVRIVFDEVGAVVTDKLAGSKKSYPAPKTPPTKDPSDSWFVTSKPAVGDKAVASSFSEEEGWRTTTVSYLGDKPFKLGDKTVMGHRLKHEHPHETFEELVDDDGLDLEFDMPDAPGLHFSRKQYTDI